MCFSVVELLRVFGSCIDLSSDLALELINHISLGRFQNLNDRYFWRRQWHPTPVLLPGESPGWRSLMGYSPWGRKESDTTEQLHFHFSIFYPTLK